MRRVLTFDFGASSGRAIIASYDNGKNWSKVEIVNSGQDNFIKSITQDEFNVYFTYADGTKITLKKIVKFGQ